MLMSLGEGAIRAVSLTKAPSTGFIVGRRVDSFVAQVSRFAGALRVGSRHGLRILMYHSITRSAPNDRYQVSVDAFERQLGWLREESGLALVPLSEGVNALAAGTMSGTAVAITFDDGYLDTLTVAAPILARREIPFTVFITGRLLSRPPERGRYLDSTALRELARVPNGTIGAHGFSHRPLTRLKDEDLTEELRASRRVLADVIGSPPTVMSYPHGAVDGRVARFAATAGFHVGATSLLGINRTGVSPMRLRRTEVIGGEPLTDFLGRIRGDYDWYQLKQRVYWPLPSP
jgi:peptidoglycan/xylan/chitin deacetylase (PgdA/CDA1 family)